ncbi:hypothetical protein [Zavarzinia aquatilis]|nr:hypothetical protein [Zavarzinia aquatilis]
MKLLAGFISLVVLTLTLTGGTAMAIPDDVKHMLKVCTPLALAAAAVIADASDNGVYLDPMNPRFSHNNWKEHGLFFAKMALNAKVYKNSNEIAEGYEREFEMFTSVHKFKPNFHAEYLTTGLRKTCFDGAKYLKSR